MPADYYVWAVDGKSVQVHFSLAVVDRLNAIVVESFRISPGYAQQVAGLLLGRSRKDSRRRIVTIDDFEPLNEMPAGLPAREGRTVVGLYRGCSGSDLRLDKTDAARIERLFKRSDLIYLLIHPNAGAPSKAGVFIQEDGRINGFATYREFPFHAGLLREGGYPLTDGMPARGRDQRILLSIGAIVLGAAAAVPWMTNAHRAQPPPHEQSSAVPPPAAPVSQPVSTPAPEPSPVAASGDSAKPSPVKKRKDRRTRLQRDDDQDPPESEAARQAPPLVAAAAPAPAEPPRVEPNPATLPAAPRATVTAVSLEPVQPGRFRRALQKIPGMRLLPRWRYKAGDRFTPAKLVRHPTPRVPEALASRMTSEVPVDLKLRIDSDGRVGELEVMAPSREPEFVRLASEAAERWQFEPALLNQHPVDSEVIARFRFRPGQ